jgi:hypothetical protein
MTWRHSDWLRLHAMHQRRAKAVTGPRRRRRQDLNTGRRRELSESEFLGASGPGPPPLGPHDAFGHVDLI